MADIAVAKEFFTAYVPTAILDKLDLNSLKLEKETFIDAAYKDTEADIVYSAKMSDTSTYLYLLCEEQTTVDPWLAFRVLWYTLRIMDLHRKQHPEGPLPLVYPMVVYIGDALWDAPLDIFPLFGDAENLAREWMFKPYQLLDVQRISDDDLHKQMLLALLLLP
jgi:predicted transposase/invertase (TIGR01784 family)